MWQKSQNILNVVTNGGKMDDMLGLNQSKQRLNLDRLDEWVESGGFIKCENAFLMV